MGEDEAFGVYGDFDGGFVPEFERKNDGIVFKIYGNNNKDVITVGSYFLKI
jgi:hypothetical protein